MLTLASQTLSFLGQRGDVLRDVDDAPVSLELPNGMVFDMTAQQYARDWLLPQFYFHLTMAYAILRNRGVEFGKADLVPHMLAHLRAGT